MKQWSSRVLAYQRLGLSLHSKHAALSLLLQILLGEGMQIAILYSLLLKEGF